MVVVTWKSRQRLKRRTPFLVISYQSSPSPSHRQTESNLSNYPRVRTSSYFQWVLILKIPSLNSLFKLWLFLEVFFLHTRCLSYFLHWHKFRLKLHRCVKVHFSWPHFYTCPMLKLYPKMSNFYLRFCTGELGPWNTLFHSASLPSFVPAVWKISQVG